MKKYLVATALSLFVLIAPSAQAETQTTGTAPTVKPMPPKKGMGDMEHGGGMKMGKMSSTTDATNNGKDSKKKGEQPEMRKAIPGVVTAISSTGFSMTARGLGKDHASTTITVVVTPTTIIKVRNTMAPMGMMGSTTPPTTTPNTTTAPGDTGTLADIIVGSKIEVFGKVSTTTKTITADRIHINSGRSGEGHGNGDNKEHGRPGMASSSPAGSDAKEQQKVSFIDKVMGFFGSANGGPAGTGFIDSLFSWFK
jgi:hypothetical protein